VCPEEGLKNGPRDRTTPLKDQSERSGAVEPGEEKAPGRPDSDFSVSKGRRYYKKEGDGLLSRAYCDRTGQEEMFSN